MQVLNFSFLDIKSIQEVTADDRNQRFSLLTSAQNPKAIKLSYNKLTDISDLHSRISFKSLAWLDLSCNQIKNIPICLAEFQSLSILYLHANQISDIKQVSKLSELKLRTVTLHGNPFETSHKQGRKGYRREIIKMLPSVKNLDFCTVSKDCPDLKLLARGKVRDVYQVDDNSILFVATDRLSAFDVIMKNGIPGKGKILTQMSLFWFELLKDVMPNHLITADISNMPAKVQQYSDQLKDRCMLVKKLEILPIESIVRGYITGSAWKEYKQKGTVCDMSVESGLKECQQFKEPLFTPSTKAEIGDHDENIHPSKVKDIIGERFADEMALKSIQLYKKANEYAKQRGIIIADTKFEFGVDKNGQLVLADEVLTPDSSRFWPASEYSTGKSQPSFDKQFVRDYLSSLEGFDFEQGIELPAEIVEKTLKKYQEAYDILIKQF